MSKKLKVSTILAALVSLLLLQWHLAASPAMQRAAIQEMTTTEMFACGIGKLTPAEVANLEEWFFRRYTAPDWDQARSRQLAEWQTQRNAVRLHQADPSPAQPAEIDVYFNSRSGVIHRHNCRYISKCTNCSPTTLAAAVARGGRWCSHCQ